MFRQWLTLVIIVLVYIPVAIDATVLHVAAPTLSMTLGASGNELLWIIDIYSLVMAGMVLPTGGMALSALSFYGLAMTDFSTQQWQAWGLMALLGFSAASALLASTSAIMAAAPAEKAAAAGAIETMAYELGAGLGIAIFGLLLSRSFSASIRLPAGLEAQEIARASSSMGEAVQLANSLPPTQGQAILDAARHAFIWSHSVALSSAGSMLLLLAVGMWFSLAKAQRR